MAVTVTGGYGMKVKLIYYSQFRERTGTDTEVRVTESQTIRQLYHELKQAHGFGLNVDEVVVAVNDAYQDDMDALLQERDVVVFLHPMAGG